MSRAVSSKLIYVFVALVVIVVAALALWPQQKTDKLRVGVVPGVYADTVKVLADEAKTQGLEIEVIEFTDWTTPNVALNSGDIDINFFQHQPFLENAIAKQGFKLTGVGKGILANFGLYSLKHKSLEDIPQDGKVGIANDPVNQGRGLLLLQKAGLLKLKPDVGFLGSLNDITDNPKNLSFVEVEGPQLVRITGDVDLALGYPHFIVASKAFDPSSGLAYSGIEDLKFGVQFVAREAKKDDPLIKKFVELFHHSAAVKEAAAKGFNHDERLYTLVWTQS
ncbi:methionine transporter [Betaproteobacteria bacterium]|nr:methionine transporter [Betaproteobacteria bacterium]GHT98959.1 methionine transporter [Betaproteobacteria bacterium]GHU13108.1 methionine transporter [Betaproteobacteria bacterium]GHU19342.1 methionine transporter [Betaproteobacteria bacterium]GHU22705.1 methionine transporter [Betaproteobacteria bacterium]